MTRSYSTDLRVRVIRSISDGLSRRRAAARFGVTEGFDTADLKEAKSLLNQLFWPRRLLRGIRYSVSFMANDGSPTQRSIKAAA